MTLRCSFDENDRVYLDFGKRARKRIGKFGDGFEVRNAEIVAANGERFDGYVVLDSTSSYEHWGTGFYRPSKNDLIHDQDEGWLEQLQLTKDELFPYAYRYYGWGDTAGYDHHIDEDTGWSRGNYTDAQIAAGVGKPGLAA